MTALLHTIPLGPLAGTEVTLWSTRSGTTVHGDRDCSRLVNSKPQPTSVRLPDDGTLADIQLPHTHCSPSTVAQHAYYRAAQAMERTAQKLASLELRSASGIAWEALVYPTAPSELHTKEAAELQPLWDDLMQRWLKVATYTHARLTPDSIALIATARLVRSGRRPREYSRLFNEMLWLGQSHLEEHKLSAHRQLTADLLDSFLDEVSAGGHAAEAWEAVRASQLRNPPLLRNAAELLPIFEAYLTSVGRMWCGALEVTAAALSRPAYALFKANAGSMWDEIPLSTLCLSLWGGASVATSEGEWVISMVPRAMIELLEETEKGTEIPSSYVSLPEPATFAAVLADLLHDLGAHAARAAITEVPRGVQPPGTTSDKTVVRLPQRGYPFTGRALRAAAYQRAVAHGLI